jgi:hypothetical protein
MARRSGKRSRGDITGNREQIRHDMEGKEAEMEVPVEDNESVGSVMDQIEYGHTAEGADEVEGALRETQDVTSSVVEERGRELERTHGESEHAEQELHDGTDRTNADRDKVSETQRKVRTNETQRGVERAIETIRGELDFLKESTDALNREREESKRREEALRARVERARR